MAELTLAGMTLRDWLAGQVVAGLMACAATDAMDMAYIAEKAYWAADAMLEARKRGRRDDRGRVAGVYSAAAAIPRRADPVGGEGEAEGADV